MKKGWYSKITSVADNYNIKNFIYDPKKQLLDPLCTVTALIEIQFRPVGTKFGINNHSITIDLPSESVTWYNLNNFQSYQRFWYCDSRENASKLGIVVQRLIEWYIIPTYELINNKCKINKKNLESSIQINSSDMTEILELWNCLDELTNYFCISLEKLMETYREGNVIWCLQNYINLINDSKNGSFNPNKIPKIVRENDDNCIDFEKIKQLWSLKTIKEITELYRKCYQTWNEKKIINDKEKEKEKDDKIKSSNSSINPSKEKKELKKVKEEEEEVVSIPSSNQEKNNINNIVLFNTIQSDIEKEKKIEGYLSAIKIFVDLVNDNFRELIVKSTGI